MKAGSRADKAGAPRAGEAAGRREPLTRARVLAAAMALADTRGLEALSMREVGRSLGVEAMSLYKHVAHKDALLDGLVELVMAEMAVPGPELGWRDAMAMRAVSARQVLLRHRWAAALMESRVTSGPTRLKLHDAVLGALRRAGFPLALAYVAYLTLDSFIYGFVLQEVSWPFSEAERPEVLEALTPEVDAEAFPHLVEIMGFVGDRMAAAARGAEAGPAESVAVTWDADFAMGLGVVLDGLERRLETMAGTRGMKA